MEHEQPLRTKKRHFVKTRVTTKAIDASDS